LLPFRAEIKELGEAVKAAGETIKSLEGRFHVMDAAIDIFAKVKRHQIWCGFAVIFAAGR
jgi:hypothetical protein